MLDVLSIAKVEENGENRYAVKPGEMYPAVIEHIRENPGIVPDYLKRPLTLISDAGWDAALGGFDNCSADLRLERDVALEIARKTFTSLLYSALGGKGKMTLHILKDDQWRLTDRNILF